LGPSIITPVGSRLRHRDGDYLSRIARDNAGESELTELRGFDASAMLSD
jgi:hypothetical protein